MIKTDLMILYAAVTAKGVEYPRDCCPVCGAKLDGGVKP